MDSPEGIALAEERLTCDERFSALVRRQSRFVFGVAYSVTRNVQDAEDVAQETFCKLFRNGKWQGIEDERAFLARVAWRVAISRLPREKEGNSDADIASSAAGPEEAAVRTNWNDTVHRMINSLPDELRLPLALSTVDELASPEIGRILGIPEGTVRTRLKRAREILKKKLAAYAR